MATETWTLTFGTPLAVVEYLQSIGETSCEQHQYQGVKVVIGEVEQDTNDHYFFCTICHSWVRITVAKVRSCLLETPSYHHFHLVNKKDTELKCCKCNYTIQCEFILPVFPLEFLERNDLKGKDVEMFNSLLLATSRGARMPRTFVQQNDFNQEFFEHLRYKPSESNPEVYTNNLSQRLARAHYELLFEFGGREALMGSHATELNEEKLNDMFVVQETLEKIQTDAKEIFRQCAAELGISVGSSSALAALVFAELMQEAGNDMNLKRKYLDAIQVIGVNSESPKDIQNALQTVNANANVPNDVAKAYAYFGLYVDVSDQLLIARYGLKMMDDKAAIDQHRQQLQIIASFKKTDMLDKFIKTGTYKEKKKRKKTAAPVTPAKQRPIATAFPVLSQKQKQVPTAATPASSSKDKQE